MANIDYKTACNILETDMYSKFEKITSGKHIILPPKYLGQIKLGIVEHLNSEVRLVSDLFDGVLIAYSNLKLKQKTGSIMDELPFIHFDIEADFIVFKPVIGCILRAKVNKISKNHIGCLVHDCFNASIPKPRHVTDVWKGCEVAVGDEVLFVVDSIYTQNRVLSLRGHLTDTRATRQKKGKKRNRTLSHNTTQETRNDEEEEEISPVKRLKSESIETALEVREKERKKTKKQKKKKEIQSETDETTLEVIQKEEKRKKKQTESETNETGFQVTEKEKNRKKKQAELETNETAFEVIEKEKNRKKKQTESKMLCESNIDQAGPSTDTCGVNSTFNSSGFNTSVSSEKKKDKKKKKHKESHRSSGVLSTSEGNCGELSDPSTFSESQSFLVKTDTSVMNSNMAVKDTNVTETKSDSSAVMSYTKLKKQKKHKHKQYELGDSANISSQENGDITTSMTETDIDNSFTQGIKKPKKHKHKKHKNDDVIESSINVSNVSKGQISIEELDSSVNLSQSVNSSGKKQKKKKKKEKLI